MKKNLKKKKGFTLIELIVVIAILGILAAIAIPRLSGVTSNSRDKADEASMKILTDTAHVLLVQGDLHENSEGNIDSATIETAVEKELEEYPTPQNKEDGDDFIISYTKGTEGANTGKFTAKIGDSDSTD